MMVERHGQCLTELGSVGSLDSCWTWESLSVFICQVGMMVQVPKDTARGCGDALISSLAQWRRALKSTVGRRLPFCWRPHVNAEVWVCWPVPGLVYPAATLDQALSSSAPSPVSRTSLGPGEYTSILTTCSEENPTVTHPHNLGDA